MHQFLVGDRSAMDHRPPRYARRGSGRRSAFSVRRSRKLVHSARLPMLSWTQAAGIHSAPRPVQPTDSGVFWLLLRGEIIAVCRLRTAGDPSQDRIAAEYRRAYDGHFCALKGRPNDRMLHRQEPDARPPSGQQVVLGGQPARPGRGVRAGQPGPFCAVANRRWRTIHCALAEGTLPLPSSNPHFPRRTAGRVACTAPRAKRAASATGEPVRLWSRHGVEFSPKGVRLSA